MSYLEKTKLFLTMATLLFSCSFSAASLAEAVEQTVIITISKPAVGSRRAMPICFHRRRCRSITGWSLSSLPPAPPRRSAWGNICRRWVFSTREATAPDR